LNTLVNAPEHIHTAEQNEDTARRLRRRKLIGRAMACIGGAGIVWAIFLLPEDLDLIVPMAKYAAVSLVSTIICLAGFPGMFHGYIKPIHLKIIDLTWVLASAVAVFIAMVQTTQFVADSERSSFTRAMEHARVSGYQASMASRRAHCDTSPSLSPTQCELLRHVAIALSNEAWVSPAWVTELCHPPMNFDKPPPGFDSDLMQACMQATTIVNIPTLPVMRDKDTVDNWRYRLSLWPILMCILVSMRIMKSVAEVFWLREEPKSKGG
jgi:hypothetical protein